MPDSLHRDTPRTRTPKPTVKARFRERQDLPDASSSVGTVRKDVEALEAVISCDARQCTRCEKCARAAASMRWASTPAHAAHLPLPSHMLLLRSREAAPATESSCGQRMRAGCRLGARVLGRHGMIPAHHAPRRSFHEVMPAADQLGQAVQLDQVRVFRFGFRSGPCRHMDSTASCAAALKEALRELQLVPTNKSMTMRSQPCTVVCTLYMYLCNL
jgi:hypothetical protein